MIILSKSFFICNLDPIVHIFHLHGSLFYTEDILYPSAELTLCIFCDKSICKNNKVSLMYFFIFYYSSSLFSCVSFYCWMIFFLSSLSSSLNFPFSLGYSYQVDIFLCEGCSMDFENFFMLSQMKYCLSFNL